MNTTLNISGMTCEHCVTSVKEEVGAIAGVDGIEVHLVPGGISTATVSAGRDIPEAELSEAVAEAGYTVVSEDA